MSQSNLPVPQAHASAAPTPASPDIVAVEPALSLLEILLRHKGKMVACVGLAMLLGVIYQLNADKVYQSTAEIFIEQSKDGQPNSPLAPGGLSAGLPSTHARLIESIPVLLKALADPEVAESETMAKYKTEGEKLRHLQKKLTVGFSKETEVVTVSFMSTVPKDTAAVVNAVLAAYLDVQKIPVAAADGQPISGDDLPRGIMDEQMIASRLMKLSEELTGAEVELEAATVRLAEAKQADGNLAQLSSLLVQSGLNAQVNGLAEVAYLKAELARLDQQLEGMPEGWGPSHKSRGPVQRQADALRYEIANLAQNAQQSMLDLLASSQRNAAERVAELNTRIAAQQARASQIAQLPIEIYQPAYVPTKKIAPKGIKSLGIATFLGFGMGLAWVLFAEMKRPATAAAGVGRSVSERTAAARQPMHVQDTTPHNVGQGAPTRALPYLMNGEDISADSNDREAAPMLGMVPEVPAGSRLTSPNFDATASSIHQIRAVLQVQARSQDTKAYAFTSPRRGAGKTSVTIGVASSLAMSGTRTLVVDCDLAGRISRGQTGAPAEHRKANGSARNGHAVGDRFGPLDDEGSSAENPSLDNIVIEQGYLSKDDTHSLATNATGQVGITGVLDGASLQDCVVKATVPGLWLLPAVHAQTRHIGKMSDAFIRDVIAQAEGHYDLVLFDTGPVPGSVEALLVTSQVNGVIVVVPQGESRQALDRTMSYLKVVGATVTGTVFNRVANAPKPESPNTHYSNLAGAAANAAGARDSRHDANHPVDPQVLVELEKNQKATDDDGEYLAGDVPLGSGILAAAVFSDADSDYESSNWKLEETSDFNGSVEELFGTVNGKKNNGTPNGDGHA